VKCDKLTNIYVENTKRKRDKALKSMRISSSPEKYISWCEYLILIEPEKFPFDPPTVKTRS